MLAQANNSQAQRQYMVFTFIYSNLRPFEETAFKTSQKQKKSDPERQITQDFLNLWTLESTLKYKGSYIWQK